MNKPGLVCALMLFILVSYSWKPERVAGKTLDLQNGFVGRWQVKFVLSGIGEKNLIFDAQAHGDGLILLQDAGPQNQPASSKVPAAWSVLDNNRVNASGEVELPLGTCCRESGTLILKGKFAGTNSISGKAIFVGSSEDAENVLGYRISTGTFTATREN